MVTQTVKSSFMDKKIVHHFEVSIERHSRLVYGFARKVLCFITHCQVTCQMSEALQRSSSKNDHYFQFYLTQIVHSNSKILFSRRNNCLSNFL